MPKYRSLQIDELRELETEFVRFLASNSITSDDWVAIKADTPGKAGALIDMFSDIVFDKILSKVIFLEHKEPRMFRVYRFFDDRVEMMGLVTHGETALDFTQSQSSEEMLAQLKAGQAQVRLFSGTKRHQRTKEMEIFQIMEEGALIAKDGTMFDTLKGLAGE